MVRCGLFVVVFARSLVFFKLSVWLSVRVLSVGRSVVLSCVFVFARACVFVFVFSFAFVLCL